MLLMDNLTDLMEAVEKYKRMFPESYTSMEEIHQKIKERKNDPVGAVFGISVAGEWDDRCYGFEVDKADATRTWFHYLGIWKC